MNNHFLKLSEEIKYTPTRGFKSVNITKAKLLEGNIFNLEFEILEIIPVDEMQNFLQHLNENFKYKSSVHFNAFSLNITKENVIGYLSMIFDKVLNNKNLLDELKKVNVKINDKEILIVSHNKILFNCLEKNNSLILRAMRRFGFNDINLIFKFEPDNEEILIKDKEELIRKTSEIISKKEAREENKEIIVKRNNSYEVVKIKDLSESVHTKVVVMGEIFKRDEKPTKTGLTIISLSLTDFSDAIYIKIFARNKNDLDEYSDIHPGAYVEVKGDYQIDSYSNEPTIIARSIRKTEKNDNLRTDDADEKRIELSARTRMSTMDGIKNPSDYVQLAEKWGHKAIAIVDQDSVQAFPEFYNATKKSDVMPIYGASMRTINKSSDAIYWATNKILATDTYVVFDLETTGLSPEYEDIIEFGATKVSDGKIVETKQFFVKPTKPIPQIITDITNISDEDVKDAKPESEAILDIRDFFADHTIVAHNANFDITFVNSKLEKYGFKAINNPTIDTMVVSRITLPTAKRYRLENVASKYNVNYDSTVAHRADYDADVLAKVWIKIIRDLVEMNIVNQLDLDKYITDDLHSRKFEKEVTLIAKNQKGLKELFKLTSIALTKQFYKSPTLFIEDLENRENILMGSGALQSRLVDKMIFGSKKQVQEEISKYDYIEVQPLKNYSHIINRGFDINDLKDMISFVVHEAKRQGKIVVATGDVRYIERSEKIYHDVYINAKGLGGKRHYLFKFNEKNPIYPEQEIMTTIEMKESFSFLADVKLIHEIVVTNTHKIFNMIEPIEVIKSDLYTPKFKDSDKNLTDLVYKNAREKYGDNLPKIIEERIERELTPIKKYGFGVIYWISHLLVGKSLKDGYLVGSRGSVGSSFVATMSEITEVNPLQPHYVCKGCKHSIFPKEAISLNSGYDLPTKECENCGIPYDREGQNIPFETFLGFEADKVPDIDLNFSGEYQPIIHNEVKNLFGEDHAFRAGTISTVAEKTAFGYVKSWAEETGKNISKPFIEFLARGVAGAKRTTGQHPGGIIVIPKEFDVEDFTPINFPANDISSSWKTTHFDFHAIHDNVLKLDLLGHDDPTAIKYLEEFTGINAKKDIPFSDPRIISLFSSPKELGVKPEDINGETTGAMGIPEFGTKFVRGMLRNAKVRSFGDLISLSGLSHGTDVWTGNAETIIQERGLTLDQVISCRDNIMTDLMNKGLDSFMAFNIMEKVRKGMGVTAEEEKVMIEHNVETWYIDSLKKIKYMFPKAHATAYVMMAWRIAWFKLYHPLAYYATYFTTRSDVFDTDTIFAGKDVIQEKLKNFESRRYKWGSEKLSNKEADLIPIFEIALEALARGINFSNINIDKSQATDWYFEKDTNTLIPPFSALDGLGSSVAISIIEARKNGEFKSVEDLKNRTSLNKTHLERFEEMGILKNLSKTNQISLDLFNI